MSYCSYASSNQDLVQAIQQSELLHIPDVQAFIQWSESCNIELEILVPTAKKVRFETQLQARKQWKKNINDTNTSASNSISVISQNTIRTLEDYIRKIWYEYVRKDEQREISTAYKYSIFNEAVIRCLHQSLLTFYTSDSSTLSPAITERLADVVFGLHKKGITYKDLQDEITNTVNTNQNKQRVYITESGDELDISRLGDVATLSKMYNELCGNTLFDTSSITNSVVDYLHIRNVKQPEINDTSDIDSIDNLINKPIVLLGFSDFTVSEIEFISELANLGKSVFIFFDYSPVNGPLFGNINDILRILANKGFSEFNTDEIGVTSEEQAMEENPEYQIVIPTSKKIFKPHDSYLRRWLFNTERLITNEEIAESFRILRCHNRMDEVETIARFVKYQLSQGVLPADIAIVSRTPEQYSQLFREYFNSAGIPVNVSDRVDLSSTPLIVALFSAFDLVVRGFERADIHRCLSNPYINVAEYSIGIEKGELFYEVAKRERLTGGSRQGGSNYWMKQLKKIVGKYEKEVGYIESNQFADEQEGDRANQYLLQSKQAFEVIKNLIEFFPEGEAKMSVGEFVTLVKEKFVIGLSLRSNVESRVNQVLEKRFSSVGLTSEVGENTYRIENRINHDKDFINDSSSGNPVLELERAERDARALTEFIRILDELEYIETELYGTTKRTFAEYVRMIEFTARSAKVQTKEKQGYGVNVTSIEQIRGIPYQIVVVCGLVDREFPLAYTPERFLGKELPQSEERHIRSERMLFHQLLGNNINALHQNKWSLVCTYPAFTDSGEEHSPSQFLSALKKITTLSKQDVFTTDVRLWLEKNTLDHELSGVEKNYVQTVHWCKQWISSAITKTDIFKKRIDTSIHQYPPDIQKNILSVIGDNSSVVTKPYSAKVALLNKVSKTNSKKTESTFSDEDSRDDIIRNKLHKLTEHAFSVSELEDYSRCAYHYFAKRILRLQTTEQESFTLTSLETGSLLHAIVYKFYTSVAQLQRNESDVFPYMPEYNSEQKQAKYDAIMVKLHQEKEPEYRKLLDTIAQEELEKIEFDSPFFRLQRDILLGYEDYDGLIQDWLTSELERSLSGWSFLPSLFELGFGMKTKGAVSLQSIKLDGLKVQGKIDRIELLKEERTDREPIIRFRIADYKTRSAGADIKDIINGVSFQMPLYILATEKILQENYNLNALHSGSVYYMFNNKDGKNQENVLIPNEELLNDFKIKNTEKHNRESINGILNNSLELAKQHVGSIAQGEFSIEPINQSVCAYCMYGSICRIKELSQQTQIDDDELGDES
jgi:ATP-dependent helicase/nuclease subunit B